MILYIGERQDEAFVNEISKGVTDEIRMVTNVHTLAELSETVEAIPSTYLIINILCIRENPNELIKQLKYIQQKMNNNLIIIASGLMTNDPMIQSLYFAGIKNVIITSWFPTIIEESIKYLIGTYQETELLHHETEPLQTETEPLYQESQGTTRLDLKEIYQDDPIILQQLEELEESNAAVEQGNQTVKLSPEELFKQDPELALQVRDYERGQEEAQSTTLYQQELPPESPIGVQPGIPQIEHPQYQFPPYMEERAPEPSTPPFSFPPYQQAEDSKPEKPAKRKKKVLLTVSLCIVLLISIAVPVVCTILHNAKKSAQMEENLLAEGMSYAAGSEITQSPEATPEQVVVGAEFEEPEAEETEEPLEVETEEPEQEEETMVTLTPIKMEELEEEDIIETETEAPVKTIKPTTAPEKTVKPAATKKPTAAPVKTKEPKSTSTPKPTNTPKPTSTPKPREIKVKSISLPDKVYVLKGGSYRMTMSYSPSNATEKISWSSSDSSVVSVSSGIIKAKKAGKATITVRSQSGKKRSCKVIVSEE